MKTISPLFKLVSIIVLIGALIYIYDAFVKPWYSKWGATEEELILAIPGDEIVSQPGWEYTQAITIRAPADQIWPWLVQIGQGRGGFYSFEFLENMIGCEIYNANQILPEFQNLQVVDNIKLHPKAPGIPVVIVESPRVLVAGGINENQVDGASWSFLLREVDTQNTRVLARFRSSYSPTVFNIALNRLFVQPTSLFMQKRMLLGIQQRVEGTFRSSTPENIQVILWLILFFLLIIILLGILFGKRWIRLFFAGLLTGSMLLFFIAWQPSIWIGIPLVCILIYILILIVRKRRVSS
ncbi:hypothetical protein JW964_26540 [candidate division KSB1 bacterium]|nr:hypothetical protein [candidate division KSB1 bacterium]